MQLCNILWSRRQCWEWANCYPYSSINPIIVYCMLNLNYFQWFYVCEDSILRSASHYGCSFNFIWCLSSLWLLALFLLSTIYEWDIIFYFGGLFLSSDDSSMELTGCNFSLDNLLEQAVWLFKQLVIIVLQSSQSMSLFALFHQLLVCVHLSIIHMNFTVGLWSSTTLLMQNYCIYCSC